MKLDIRWGDLPPVDESTFPESRATISMCSQANHHPLIAGDSQQRRTHSTLYWSPRWLNRIVSLLICGALPSMTVSQPDCSFWLPFKPSKPSAAGKMKPAASASLTHDRTGHFVKGELNNYPASFSPTLILPNHNCWVYSHPNKSPSWQGSAHHCCFLDC